MAVSPRSPVLAGVGQVRVRPAPGDDPSLLPEPTALMAEALRRAGEDSGVGDRLLRRAESVRVAQVLSFRYANPALLVAHELGAQPAELVVSTGGGNSPQMLLNDAAEAIAAGKLDVALVTGAEAVYSRVLARRQGRPRPQASEQPPETEAPVVLGSDRPGLHPVEEKAGLTLPIQVYPIFEQALRKKAGRSIPEHRALIARLWSRFSEVAAKNPFAWSPRAYRADEIGEASPDNRMVAFPYTKLLTANIQVNLGAGLILCSLEAARLAGVPKDRLVFLRSGAEANDHWWVSERNDLASSPALRFAGREALALAGVGIDEVAHVDLYSCFPSAVEVAAEELGLGLEEPDRPLTVTGGLTFAGGPGNAYATHAVAAMVQVLREDPGSVGLVSALGWYLTKHALGVYSTEPGAVGFRRTSVQDRVDALPRRRFVGDAGDEDVASALGVVEAYTVLHDRQGAPELGILACLLEDGRRTWANLRDPEVLSAIEAEDACGRGIRLGPVPELR